MMDKLVETVRSGMLNDNAMAQSVTSFLPRGPGLNHNSLNVEFVVGMLTKIGFLYEYFGFSLSEIFDQCSLFIHSFIHSSIVEAK
jgi:hypothetical protein